VAEGPFLDRDGSGAVKLGDVPLLSAMLFLRAWTPARLWADWRAAILAAGILRPRRSRAYRLSRGSSATGDGSRACRVRK
jgi:hypothetical protein